MPRIDFMGKTHEFPDSFTDEQIALALRSEIQDGKALMQSAHTDKIKSKAERKAAIRATLAAGKSLPGVPLGLSDVNEHLPAIAGMVGGAAGGIPGAALGGMAGKAAQYGMAPLIGEDSPQGSPPMNVLGEGANQGAMQGVGNVLSSGINAIGKAAYPLMKHSMKVGRKIYKDFPGVDPVDDALRHGISPEPGHAAPGTAAAEMIRDRAAQTQKNAVHSAWQGGYPGATSGQIAAGPGMRSIHQTLREGTAPVTDPSQIEDLILNEFFAAHPPGTVIDPMLMNKMRQAAGAVAFAGPEQSAGNMARGATTSNWKLYNEGLWKNLTAEMEQHVPNFRELNLETQKAIALERAMKAVENPAESSLPYGFWQAVIKSIRGTKMTGKAALAAQKIGRSPRTKQAADVAQQAPRGLEEILRYLQSPDSTEVPQ